MSTVRSRLAAADPLVAVLAVVSLVVYALHGFDGALRRDLGVYVYGAQRFLDGVPPYEGILNRAGPLAHVLPAVGIWGGRLFGIGDVHAARLFYMLVSVACVCLVHVLGREVYGSRGAGLVAATAFLGFQGFLDMATNGPREKTPMVLFLLVALIALRHRRWATVGVFVALATLTWQPVFFIVLVAGLTALLLMPSGRWVALLRVVVGGALTSAVVLFYYAVHHALHAFFEGFVLINARYTQQRGVTSSKTWGILVNGFGPSLYLVLLGLVALPVIAALAVRPAWRTREAAPVMLVALGTGWLTGIAWAGKAFNGYPDLFVLLPFAALGLGGLAAAALRWARPRFDVKVVTAAVTGVAALLTVFAVVTSVTTRGHALLRQEASVAAVLHHAPSGATVVSVQAPEALVLSHRVNPTKIQMFLNGFNHYVDDTWPGGLQGYADYLVRTRPTLIAVQDGLHMTWLDPVLTQHYHQIGRGPTFTWWASTDLPPAVMHGMHEAHVRAMAEHP